MKKKILTGFLALTISTVATAEHRMVDAVKDFFKPTTISKTKKTKKKGESSIEESIEEIANKLPPKELDILKEKIAQITPNLENVAYNKTMKRVNGNIIVGHNYNMSKYGITEEAASKFVEEEIAHQRAEMEKIDWYNKLDPVRQEAILNMCFNLGRGGMLKFKTMINHLKNGNYEAAGNSLLYGKSGKSKYYSQVKGRAKEIADQLKTGKAKEDILTTLKRHEGFRKFPYQDTRGIWTVGYGINLEGRGLTEEESKMIIASSMLDNPEVEKQYKG